MPSAPDVIDGPRPAADASAPGAERGVISRLGRAGWWLAAVVVGVLGLSSLGPFDWGRPSTGLSLVLRDTDGLLVVDVDRGVSQTFATADEVAARVGAVHWLESSDGVPRWDEGRVPPWTGGRKTVGAVGGGLLTLVGTGRVRRLQIWDVGYAGVTSDLGTATDVTGVNEREALVTYGCQILGCPTDLVDLVDGSRTEVLAPPGYALSESALAPDGTIALGVTEEDGKYSADGEFAVLVGRPGAWRTVAELQGLPWEDLEWGPDGWLLVHLVTGDVTLWRAGQTPVTTDLPQGSRLLGVSASR